VNSIRQYQKQINTIFKQTKVGMSDNYRYIGLRKKLIDSIRVKGIQSEAVLKAMDRVPRHLFMDSSFIKFSYTDKAFPISSGQTISQPYTVAFQTELLKIKKHSKILEIGTGSGYQTAVLLELGARVYTIERQHELFLSVQKTLGMLNYKPNYFYGDGYEGLKTFAPFDGILVTAAAPEVPELLLKQLSINGKLVIPVGDRFGQKMIRVIRESEDSFQHTEHGHFSFVPLLRGKNN